MTATLLELKGLEVGYRKRRLCRALDASFPAGCRLGIIGGNGSGKSTFMRTILGLIPSLAGSYAWAPGTGCGYVPQEHQINFLFPLTVRDLLKMGRHESLSRWRSGTENFDRAAASAAETMGIAGIEGRLVRELSGGQRQRALIARALIGQPAVLVLDEPFNSLDYRFKQKMWRLLDDRRGLNLSQILIDHDLNRIVNHVDWVVLIGGGCAAAGPTLETVTEENLGRVFQTPVRVTREGNEGIEVHFL